jgi:hypothetical protein
MRAPHDVLAGDHYFMPGFRFGRLDLCLQFVRQPFIVIVEQGNPAAARSPYANISGLSAATAFHEAHPNKPVVFNSIQFSFTRCVGPIDYDDHFDLPLCLLESAQDRPHH